MGARTKARKRAIDILYAADVRGLALHDALKDAAQRAASEPERQSSWMYAREVIDGIIDNAAEIDEYIEGSAKGWSLERMPAVDRAIIRVAVWELLYNDEVPAGVAIDEAVEAAKAYSTDDSSRFVNGLLGRVSAQLG